MINKLIEISIKNKLLVGIHILALIIFGIYAMLNMNVDAVPDITNNQVQVVTISPSLAPQEVEQFVTYPIEMAMANLQGVDEIRSISRYGLSVVTIVFSERIPILDARQLVSEMLGPASDEIPEEYGTPELMPITTGLGEIYQYTLEVDSKYKDKYSLADLRTIHDWIVKRQLSGTKGIVEVSGFGGFIKQYEVAVHPATLRLFDITLSEIVEALKTNNQNTGGSYIQDGPYAKYIRAEGILTSIADIEYIVVKTNNNIPVLIKDIATVQFGSPARFGAMTKDGEGEVVGGITLMLKGGNANKTIENIKDKIAQIQKSLPEGVSLVAYQDRSQLVDRVISTITTNLTEAAIIVLLVLVLLLGNFRAGLIVTSVIPLSLLFAFILMYFLGVSASVMSLGAIDFGLIVDGAVIMVEGVLFYFHSKYMGKKITSHEMGEIVTHSSKSSAKSAVFGVIIILIVYFPILALTGIEGKMFSPMAMTISFALIGSILLSLTYVPMMMSLFLSKKISDKKTFADKIMDKLSNGVGVLLNFGLKYKMRVITVLSAFFIGSLFLFTQLGAVFVPNLEEGDLAMQMTLPPGSSLNESIKISTKAEEILLNNFPEVKTVISKIGTAEVPTDPMAIEDADIMIIMKDKEDWETTGNREELVELMKDKLSVITGASFDFTQPIQLRFNELLTGAKSDVVIKIYGEDLSVLFDKANIVADKIKNIQGAADIKVEQVEGLPQVVFKYKRDKISEYGLNVSELNEVIRTALAGQTAGVIFEGERKFDLVVRLEENSGADINSIKKLFIKTASGTTVFLDELIDIEYKNGPMQIARDDTHRRITIGINVRNRDVKSLVTEIREKVDTEVKLPAGYYFTYGGQFKNLEDATNRLMIVVPIALGLILLLLFLAFGSMKQALIVYATIPLSIIGGIFALWVRGLPFSISAGVGFIALFGVAVLNGIVLINSFNSLEKEGVSDILQRIKTGVKDMVRPVTLTTLVAAFGFIPMAISQQAGAEVQRPLATVVIGGILVAAILTLVVIPIFYYLMYKNKPKMNKKIIGVIAILLMSLPYNAFSQNSVRISISKAIEIANRNNNDLKNAKFDVLIAEKDMKSKFNLGKTEFDYSNGQLNSSVNDYSISLMQNLGNPMEMFAEKKLSKTYLGMEESKFNITKKDIEYQLANTYCEYGYNYSSYILYKDFSELFKKAAEIVELRYNNGDISVLEKNYIIDKYKLIQWKLSDIEIEKQKSLLSFNNVILSDTIFIPDVEKYCEMQLKAEIADTANIDAHPQVKYYNLQSEYYKQNISAKKSMLFPEISVGYFNQQIDNVKGFSGWQVSVAVPLWFVPEKNKISQAKVEYEQSLSNTEYVKKSFARNYENVISKYELLQKRIKYFETDGITNAEKIIEKSSKLYQIGEIEYIDYIQHINNALDMKESYLKALFEYNKTINLINYYNAKN